MSTAQLTFTELIDQAELTRENGKHAEALQFVERAIILTAEQGKIEDVINALGHKMIIYKHKFQSTDNPVFNELMYGDVQTGLALVEQHSISGQPKALMLYRSGDYFLWKKDTAKALTLYEQAWNELPKDEPGKSAEYLSKYALALAMSGNIEDGVAKQKEALALAENDNSLRPFHKLTITSGILFRLALIYHIAGKEDLYKETFESAMVQAQELKDKYDVGMRLVQAERAKEKFGLI